MKINHSYRTLVLGVALASCHALVFAQATSQPVPANSSVNPMLPPGTRLAPPAAMPAPMPAPQAPTAPINRADFAVEQIAPLNADEIRQVLQELQKRRQAGQENLSGRPAARAVTSSETIDLTPGAPPPIVRVAPGEGAIISFIDAAGRAWPIAENLNFNSRAFDVKLIAPHLYSLSIKTSEKANMAVVLKGLDKPIIFTVVPAQTETDYLKEFIIPQFVEGKPPASAAVASASGAVGFNAPELLNFLYRTIPADSTAKALRVGAAPSAIQVWQISPSRMVVRSGSMVVLPGWVRRHSSSDGTSVYEVPLSPVVTVSEGGVLHRVQISEFIVTPESTGKK